MNQSGLDRTTGELLSASTLKRLWGYVTSHPVPRLSTLGIGLFFNGKEFAVRSLE